MLKMICFDMDGTIADLYAVPNWLEKLRAYDASPYLLAEPMCDMEELAFLLEVAQHRGIEVRVISWLSKESTKEYDELVRITKRAFASALHRYRTRWGRWLHPCASPHAPLRYRRTEQRFRHWKYRYIAVCYPPWSHHRQLRGSGRWADP